MLLLRLFELPVLSLDEQRFFLLAQEFFFFAHLPRHFLELSDLSLGFVVQVGLEVKLRQRDEGSVAGATSVRVVDVGAVVAVLYDLFQLVLGSAALLLLARFRV